jgi:membrane-associated phospholipid phosphatase
MKYVWVWGILLGPVFAALAYGAGQVPDSGAAKFAIAILVSVLLFAFGLLRRKPNAHPAWNYLFFLTFLPSIPAFYAAVGVMIPALQLPHLDPVIASIDRFLLGWLFPLGQVSLFVDRSPVIGPLSLVGKVTTEWFQAFYVTHYVWGYFLFFALMAQRRWEELTRFTISWVGAYYATYVSYALVPVIGPIHHYKDLYMFQADGFGVARAIRLWLMEQQGTLEDCFPSGHTAIAWISAICALKTYPRYGKVVAFAAFWITGATLYLRYHYVTDLLGAAVLVTVALAAGGWITIPRALACYKARPTGVSQDPGR